LAADRSNPERWLVVTVRGPSAASIDAAAEGLFALGAAAVEELEDAVRSYLPGSANAERVAARLHSDVVARTGETVEIGWEWQADEDWAAEWRRGLGPRRVGERIIVAPSWSDPELRNDDLLVVIDPQMAFGTGEHASTRGALRLLQRCLQPGDVVLDVGTGSGVLAIAAARLGAGRADAVDSDADALVNAYENVAANGVAERIVLAQTCVDAAYLEARAERYDVITANVLSSVLLPLLPAFRRALRATGCLILAGILESECEVAVRAARHAGFTVQAEDREEEWWSGLLRSA
jgi:ribosomal protein L11 methyltransferase